MNSTEKKSVGRLTRQNGIQCWTSLQHMAATVSCGCTGAGWPTVHSIEGLFLAAIMKPIENLIGEVFGATNPKRHSGPGARLHCRSISRTTPDQGWLLFVYWSGSSQGSPPKLVQHYVPEGFSLLNGIPVGWPYAVELREVFLHQSIGSLVYLEGTPFRMKLQTVLTCLGPILVCCCPWTKGYVTGDWRDDIWEWSCTFWLLLLFSKLRSKCSVMLRWLKT